MANRMPSGDQAGAPLMPKKIIAKILKQRTNPDAPESLNENEAVFFAQPAGLHEQLIGLATQGAEIPVEAFIQALGPVDGPKVFEVYNSGLARMKEIVDIKTDPSNHFLL